MISLSDLQYSLLIAPSLQRSKHGYDFGGACNLDNNPLWQGMKGKSDHLCLLRVAA
jgi:hypothetical protein